MECPYRLVSRLARMLPSSSWTTARWSWAIWCCWMKKSPHVMYMHYEGHGDALQLAQSLHQALSASATPLSPAVPPPAAAPPSGPQLDMGTLDGILGYSGRANGSVVQYTIARSESITEMG